MDINNMKKTAPERRRRVFDHSALRSTRNRY